MKIKLTAYKQMAHDYAARIETKTEPDFRKIVGIYVSDLSDAEFDGFVLQLRTFWEQSRYEYSAIYFWMEY